MSQEGLIPLDREVEAQQRLVEEIVASRNRQAEILTALPVAVTLLDEALCVEYANAAASRLWGDSCEPGQQSKLVGTSVFDILHPEDVEHGRELVRMVEQGEVDLPGHLVRIIDKDDRKAWMNLKICKLVDGGLLCTFEDQTTRLRHEAELLKSQRLESIGRLAGGLAHDFNNFLAVIMGNLNIAQINLGTIELAKSELEMAIMASQQASDITKQMLTFSEGGAPITEIVSIVDIVRDAAAMNAHGSKLRIVMDIDESMPAVEVDSGQIHQVFGNLIINADQAMPRGGELQIRLKRGFLAADSRMGADLDAAVIEFEDQGVGIPEEEIDLVTDPYYTTKVDGTGLGLSTAFWIVQRHNGRLVIESKQGSGTTIRVVLPLTKNTLEVGAIESCIKSDERSLSVLIMDDNEQVRRVLRLMLESLGHQVVETCNGELCVEEFKHAKEMGNPHELVILDLTVPGGLGGRWAFEHLREIDPKICAIVASGYGNDSVLASPEAFGFKGRLQKPFLIGELEAVIHDVLPLIP